MGRADCTEPQCLYKGALYLYLLTETIDFVFIPYLFIVLVLGVTVVTVAAQISRHLLHFAYRLMNQLSLP